MRNIYVCVLIYLYMRVCAYPAKVVEKDGLAPFCCHFLPKFSISRSSWGSND